MLKALELIIKRAGFDLRQTPSRPGLLSVLMIGFHTAPTVSWSSWGSHFFKKDFIYFLGKFRFKTKLRGRHRDVPYSPCPLPPHSLPMIHTPHQSRTCVTTDELTLTHRLKSVVYLWVHSWCCIFYGFGQLYNDVYLSR